MLEDYSEGERLAFCQAMANIVASDHKVTDKERVHLDGLIMSTGLSPADDGVIRTIDAELKDPGAIGDILKRIKHKALKSALFRMLIETAVADGSVAKQERAKILEAAAAFKLDKKAAGELIDWTIQAIRQDEREREILSRLG